MLLKTKALTTALLSGLCVSAMAAAQESRPAGQTPPPAETGVPTPAVGQPDTTATPEATGTTGAQAAGKRSAEETITVTGLPHPPQGPHHPAPVTVISREQVVASGKVSIGDFLQSLPEQGNAINTSVNNGGDGSTRVSLRGLGTQRTLVLLNGRRMVPGERRRHLRRSELHPDGGDRANRGTEGRRLGRLWLRRDRGVVNIITRKTTGRRTSMLYRTGAEGRRTTYDINFTTGTGGDRGNITFSAGYYNQQPIWAGDRDWSKHPRGFDAVGKTSPLKVPGQYAAGASGTIPQGRIVLPTDDAATCSRQRQHPVRRLDRCEQGQGSVRQVHGQRGRGRERRANAPLQQGSDRDQLQEFRVAPVHRQPDPGAGRRRL